MTDDLAARDLAVFWHPCSQMRDYQTWAPLAVVGARGLRLQLQDGRTLLDGISSWWCKSFGHGHPRLRAALVAQAEAFEHVITANTTSAPLVRLCERLLALGNGLPVAAWGRAAPPGRAAGHFGKVFLADNGSTAVEIALKMAVQAQAQRGQPQRTHLCALQNGYHGETVGALSVGDLGLYADPYRALMFPVTKLGPLPYRSGPDDRCWMDDAAEWPAIAARLESVADRLAAIVYEPVLQAAGGMRLFSPSLLRRLRAWATANGVYLIADEIAAGLGRCGALLASHLADAGPLDHAGDVDHVDHVDHAALPDLAVVSKGLTGGFLPLSAVLITDAMYALFDADYGANRGFLHSNTYTGNALAVAVANAALDVLAEEAILDNVAVVGARLRRAVAALATTRPFLRDARGCGMVAAVDLCATDGGALPAARRTGYQVYRQAVQRGALLRPLGDTLYLFPPLNTSAEDCDQLVDVLGASIDAVMRG